MSSVSLRTSEILGVYSSTGSIHEAVLVVGVGAAEHNSAGELCWEGAAHGDRVGGHAGHPVVSNPVKISLLGPVEMISTAFGAGIHLARSHFCSPCSSCTSCAAVGGSLVLVLVENPLHATTI